MTNPHSDAAEVPTPMPRTSNLDNLPWEERKKFCYCKQGQTHCGTCCACGRPGKRGLAQIAAVALLPPDASPNGEPKSAGERVSEAYRTEFDKTWADDKLHPNAAFENALFAVGELAVAWDRAQQAQGVPSLEELMKIYDGAYEGSEFPTSGQSGIYAVRDAMLKAVPSLELLDLLRNSEACWQSRALEVERQLAEVRKQLDEACAHASKVEKSVWEYGRKIQELEADLATERRAHQLTKGTLAAESATLGAVRKDLAELKAGIQKLESL